MALNLDYEDLKVGNIYRIKEDAIDKCGNYCSANGKYICITELNDYDCLDFYYDILNDHNEIVAQCSDCYDAQDLIPIEKEIFRIGDEVKVMDQSCGWGPDMKPGDKAVIIDIIDGKLFLQNSKNTRWMCLSKDVKIIKHNDGNNFSEWSIGPLTKPEPSSIKKMLQNIPKTLKRVLSPSLTKQYRAGLINGELGLTEKGNKEMLDILSQQEAVQDELTKCAEEIIKTDKKEEE